MKRIRFYLSLFGLSIFGALTSAQVFPTASFSTVTANPDGTLRAPVNFWDANKIAIADVLANGIATPADLDGKLDKVSIGGRVYGTDASGNQTLLGYSVSAQNGYLVQRQGGGADAGGIMLPLNPSAANYATSKSYVDARTPQPAYALFNITLGDQWTDFELKATLSNFGEHTPFTDLYLYYHSPDPGRTVITSQTGPKPTVFFTDSGNADHRRWRKQTATQSIWAMRTRTTAIIPAVVVVVPVDTTITPTNAALIWSYCRISATDYERDATGSTIWHPIIPTWSTIAPTP